MRKFVLTFIIFLAAAGSSFAQNNIEGMRLLTVNALMQYGQKLYDRGDFDEATAVFNHVLTFDSHQSQALKYLKDMGHFSSPPISPTVAAVDVDDTDSLKQAIEAKQHSIEKLQAQITQLRANIASQSLEEKLN